jgi:hypothetical protein
LSETYSAPIAAGLRTRRGHPSAIRLVAAAVAFGITVLSGCGGSDSTGTDLHAAPAAERIRFAAQGDPICRAAVQKIRALRIVPSTSPNSNALSSITDSLVRPGIRILTQEAAGLRSIQPRPDDSDLQRYLGLYDPILVLAQQRLDLAADPHPDSARAQRIEKDIAGLEQAQEDYAKSFGFKVCGTGFFAALSVTASG